MAHFPDKLAHLFQKVAQLWLILGFNLAHFRNFHLETLLSHGVQNPTEQNNLQVTKKVRI